MAIAKTDHFYHQKSDISETWDSSEQITHDIKWFLIQANDAGGEELVKETARAIMEGIARAQEQIKKTA